MGNSWIQWKDKIIKSSRVFAFFTFRKNKTWINYLFKLEKCLVFFIQMFSKKKIVSKTFQMVWERIHLKYSNFTPPHKNNFFLNDLLTKSGKKQIKNKTKKTKTKIPIAFVSEQLWNQQKKNYFNHMLVSFHIKGVTFSLQICLPISFIHFSLFYTIFLYTNTIIEILERYLHWNFLNTRFMAV